VGLYERTSARVAKARGTSGPLENLSGLDIGPGQQLGCLRCFSLKNEMTGIDTDVIARGFSPLDYLRMLRHNTAQRTAKTLVRKLLGVDASFAAQIAEHFGVRRFPEFRVLRMSATQMRFPDESFDFVYSHSVFEHIDDPEAALREVRRVLKPGGVADISIHLYTSHSGSHDPKVFAQGTDPPLWPHLREAYKHTVHPNTYLNKVSLEQWREMFARVMPGTELSYDSQAWELSERLSTLRESGELSEYSDEELMTVNLVGSWSKKAP
jgi:SAM-dependent methyltransferase